MKPRAAAVLAFVVWYLIQPPADPNAPLSKWARVEPPYDSEDQCLRAIANLNNEINKSLSQGLYPTVRNDAGGYTPRALRVFIPAMCISRDDLQKKTGQRLP